MGWLLAVFGIAFGASGFAVPDDRATLIVMMLAGAAFSAAGLALATSRAHVGASGIRYRNGLIGMRITRSEIINFALGPGSGAPPARVAYVVLRKGRRPVRLTGLQRWDSDRARAAMTTQATQVANVLGLPESAQEHDGQLP